MQRTVPRPNRFGRLVAPGEMDENDNAFLRLIARAPAVQQAYVTAQAALAQGRLVSTQRELISLAVAEINNSKFGVAMHSLAGRRMGLSEQDIELARRASAVEPRNLAMLEFTRAVTLQRGEVSDADFDRLRSAGFADAEIAEIVAHVALNIFANYLNNVACIQPEPGRMVPVAG
jgi:uncharacterized peroxidase-related enzyme